jgi:hypothetical protein
MKHTTLCALVLLLATQLQCTLGDAADDHVGYAYGDSAADTSSWRDQLVSIVDTEVERLSTYASNEGGLGACVATWTVGGAVVGEAASKTCTVIGVASIETGIGGVAAAVCVGADLIGADAVLGAAAGYVAGHVACGAGALFDRYLSGFRLFNVGADSDEGSADGEIDDYNTPECAAQYDEYKQVCGQPRSCIVQGLSCDEKLRRHDINDECVYLRSRHLYDCPHPDDFDWQGHEQAISDAYLAQQRCKSELCTVECIDELDASLALDFDRVCYAGSYR